MSTKRMFIIAAAAILAAAIIAVLAAFLPNSADEKVSVTIPDMHASVQPSEDLGEDDLDALPIVDINSETVGRVVKTMKRAEVYSRIVRTTTYFDGGEKQRFITVYAQNGAYSITVSGDREKHIIISGGRVYVWYLGDSEYYTGAAADDTTRLADEYQRMITWEDIASLPAESVMDAYYDDAENSASICVKYVSGELGYVTECRIDIASGLVSEAKTYDGDTLVYSMSNEILNLGLVPASVFTLPDGTNAISGS
ncbi:MAG: hypothetical protein HUJ65_00095 [Oscillospiraceae bacterium]|nr:hypothetical protein [Oscillospiraceae bacterium]